jgi:hypothetical protein
MIFQCSWWSLFIHSLPDCWATLSKMSHASSGAIWYFNGTFRTRPWSYLVHLRKPSGSVHCCLRYILILCCQRLKVYSWMTVQAILGENVEESCCSLIWGTNPESHGSLQLGQLVSQLTFKLGISITSPARSVLWSRHTKHKKVIRHSMPFRVVDESVECDTGASSLPQLQDT